MMITMIMIIIIIIMMMMMNMASIIVISITTSSSHPQLALSYEKYLPYSLGKISKRGFHLEN
jgi:hypothetical protein